MGTSSSAEFQGSTTRNSPDGRRPSKADAKHTAAHDAIMHAFQMFDIDSDGRITREEFVSALTRKCAKDGRAHSLTEDQANALFDEADVDRSNCIDAEEVNKMRRRTSTTHLILFRPFYFSR